MRITVLSETDPVETRAAITPEMVKKYKNLGADVVVQAGAGSKANISDAELEAAGAAIAQSAEDAVRGADIVLKVRRPADGELNGLKDGALVIGIMDPYGQDAALKTLADAGAAAFAMELMPRITRAQVMDVLSSQANLAGYRAVVDAAEEYGKAIPMMMTAAGTVPAARIFVMGAGVAGLQAIATARRMGGIVTATDVRPAAKEQVESLGAKFVAVEDEEFRQAETAGGYAKEMSKEYQAKQAELVSSPPPAAARAGGSRACASGSRRRPTRERFRWRGPPPEATSSVGRPRDEAGGSGVAGRCGSPHGSSIEGPCGG